MRAALINAMTGPTAVEVQEVPEPKAGSGQVLVDVHYAGVVFADVLNTRGEYQMRPEVPFIPGWDVAGTVRQDAAGFRAGDRVAAMPLIGGFAETVAVDAASVFPLPDQVSLSTAAALPLNYLTMHFALHHRAHLRVGETVLVHGAAGGLGMAACQLAAAYGARVVAVVSTTAKSEIARSAGAHDVAFVDGFRNTVRRITDNRGVDVIVDPVGGDRFIDSLRCLTTEGRLLVMGFAGRSIPSVKVNRLLLTNTAVMGAASEEYWQINPDYPRQQWSELLPMITSGAVRPSIGHVLPLSRATEALLLLDERRTSGRVLIQLRAD
jgi:NADPH2:quinone reductase